VGHRLSHPGPQGQNHCPVHPSEPIVGLCGCGTFFCRKCSPSAVFCASCHSERQRMTKTSPTYMAMARSGLNATPAGRSHAHAHVHHHARPLSQRVLLEALLLTIVSIMVLGLVWQNDSSLSSDRSFSFGIDAGQDPAQSQTSPFRVNLAVDSGMASLSSESSYSINAKVESTHTYDDSISAVVPMDLLLAWGDMTDPDVDGRLTWKQDDRQGTVSGMLGGGDGADVTSGYVIGHVSNNHLIPANAHIRAALATIKPGDMVKIDGRLVDVKLRTDDNRVLTVQTSKSRSDQGDGACEIIYVERIKINDRAFK
jgi:hypothetical protein